ncbi:MAG: sulfotransferase family protein [Anaerolineales bacterium]|nr:sulfotransferase family protein [Anaerolineales bacterium]
MTSITNQQVHVSVDIEGTTNSSFLAELGNIYGTDQVLIYKVSLKRFVRLSDIPHTPATSLLKLGKDLLNSTPLFAQNSSNQDERKTQENHTYTRKNLPPDTAVVHGHFTPSMFKGVFHNPFISIILKDPLERMISLYEEWKQKKGGTDWRVTIPFDNKLSFTDFALQERFNNFQSKCLGNRRLGDYDLVGVAECQPGFIAQLKNKDWTGYVSSKSTGYPLDKPRFKNLGITQEFIENFQTVNQMDYAIYLQAKEFIGYC